MFVTISGIAYPLATGFRLRRATAVIEPPLARSEELNQRLYYGVAVPVDPVTGVIKQVNASIWVLAAFCMLSNAPGL